jgi:hypothetical protein
MTAHDPKRSLVGADRDGKKCRTPAIARNWLGRFRRKENGHFDCLFDDLVGTGEDGGRHN